MISYSLKNDQEVLATIFKSTRQNLFRDMNFIQKQFHAMIKESTWAPPFKNFH